VFVNAFSDDMPREDKEDLVDHVLTCGRCRTKFEVLNELNQDSILSRELSGSDHRSQAAPFFKRFSWKSKLAVTTAIFLLILSSVLYIVFQPTADAVRGDQTSGLVLIKPEETVSEPPSLFIWSAPANADGYILKLVDENLETLFEESNKGKENNRLRMPEEIRNRLQPEVIYIWSVEAYDNEGNTIASGSKSFVIH
jgi:hypothetical protein